MGWPVEGARRAVKVDSLTDEAKEAVREVGISEPDARLACRR